MSISINFIKCQNNAFTLITKKGMSYPVQSREHVELLSNNILRIRKPDQSEWQLSLDDVGDVKADPETDYSTMRPKKTVLAALKRLGIWVTAEDVTAHVRSNGGCLRRPRVRTGLYATLSAALSGLSKDKLVDEKKPTVYPTQYQLANNHVETK